MNYVLFKKSSVNCADGMPTINELDYLFNHSGIKIIEDLGRAYLVEELKPLAIDEIKIDLRNKGGDWIIEMENTFGLFS